MKAFLEHIYRGRKVLITGHTGFKGSWLALWLTSLGAEVHGYALDPQEHETLYDQLGLLQKLASDTRADLADRDRLTGLVADLRPDYLFHLAAQPLVRLSYSIPVETFATNVMGTIHVLEALRLAQSPCRVVIVTTDKCYENREWLYAYREIDPMGGHDPYSTSKGCAELVASCYRRSFFADCGLVRMATCRAGNVIGGGDWAVDRIVPDCIRALRGGEPVPVRNRHATRPWQHVLEPLSGYLLTAAALQHPEWWGLCGTERLDSFNFGPQLTGNRTVAELVDELIRHFPDGRWEDYSAPCAVHEASKLNLSIDKAWHLLGWQPAWDFTQTVANTAQWYRRDAEEASDMTAFTLSQIDRYQQDQPSRFPQIPDRT